MRYFELTKEEKEILNDFEKGKLVSIKDNRRLKTIYQKAAANTLAKTKNINLRISERALARLKAKAAQEGIPYQTLASSILYRYTSS